MDNSNRNKKKKGSPLGILVFLGVYLIGILFNASDSAGERTAVVIAVAVVAVIVVVIASASKKKSSAAQPVYRQPNAAAARQKATQPQRTPGRPVKVGGAEQPVRCDHSRGREKYLEQIEGYLKNGIIDKAEYRILYDRYSRLELPEDYH